MYMAKLLASQLKMPDVWLAWNIQFCRF